MKDYQMSFASYAARGQGQHGFPSVLQIAA